MPAWCGSCRERDSSRRLVVSGDLNAFESEPPLASLEGAGLRNQVRDRAGAGAGLPRGRRSSDDDPLPAYFEWR